MIISRNKKLLCPQFASMLRVFEERLAEAELPFSLFMAFRDWQTQDGQKRNTVEVIADNIQFLRAGAKQGAPASAGKQTAPGPDEVGTIDLNDEGAIPQADPAKAPSGADEEAPF